MKERPVFPLLMSMALPNVISMLVNSLYNIVDSLFVARINESAMTALSLVFPVQNLLNAIAIGFGIGINALVALCLGAGEHKRVRQLYQITLILSAAIMAAGTLGCLAASEPLMRLFTSTPETVEAGKVALRIICLGFVVSAISTTSSGALEGLGKGTQSLVISLCRYIVFIMPLAWVLCRQFGPVGVWNAFWATEVLSAIVSLIVYKKSV